MEYPDQTSLIRAVRRLTISIWALVAVLALFLGIYLVAYIPWIRFSLDDHVSSLASSSPPDSNGAELRNFHAMPLEKQIEAASVIAISQYEKDGDRLKCVVSEILKQSPNINFYYKIGDEYRQCSRYPKQNEDYGDGQIMFFIGNPADFTYSTSFRGNRVTGLGDMTIEELRARIKSQNK
jgi:hypothetical protein